MYRRFRKSQIESINKLDKIIKLLEEKE